MSAASTTFDGTDSAGMPSIGDGNGLGEVGLEVGPTVAEALGLGRGAVGGGETATSVEDGDGVGEAQAARKARIVTITAPRGRHHVRTLYPQLRDPSIGRSVRL